MDSEKSAGEKNAAKKRLQGTSANLRDFIRLVNIEEQICARKRGTDRPSLPSNNVLPNIPYTPSSLLPYPISSPSFIKKEWWRGGGREKLHERVGGGEREGLAASGQKGNSGEML
jgi:hypothetical protein